MNRFRRYGPGDDPEAGDGDKGFQGVSGRENPCLIAAGFVAEAKNARFSDGIAQSRAGWLPMAWGIGAAITTHHGCGRFSDPNGIEWLLWAVNGKVYRLNEGNSSIQCALPSGEVLNGAVRFTQCFNVVVLTGPGCSRPMVMADVMRGFTYADEEVLDAGMVAIPNGDVLTFMQNRLCVAYAEETTAGVADLLAVGEIGEYAQFFPADGALRINEGESDVITALEPISDSAMVVGKEHSIHLLFNLIPNEAGQWADAQRDMVTDGYGIVAPRSVVRIGSDTVVLGLSQRGVEMIRQRDVLSTRYQGTKGHAEQGGQEAEFSYPIRYVTDRINWKYASAAVGAFWSNRYYLAVPIDGSAVNNAILVYDWEMGAWAGYDTWSGASIADMVVLTFQGVERLFLVTTAGAILMYEAGAYDGAVSVQFEVLTRGYGGGERLNYSNWEIAGRVWFAQYSVSLECEEKSRVMITDRNPSAVAYSVWGATPWDVTNVNDDHATQGRGDYSLGLDRSATGVKLGNNGIELDTMARLLERGPVRLAGAGLQLRIGNKRGYMGIDRVVVGERDGPRRY